MTISSIDNMFLEYRHAELVSAAASFILRFRNEFEMTYCKHTITIFKFFLILQKFYLLKIIILPFFILSLALVT